MTLASHIRFVMHAASAWLPNPKASSPRPRDVERAARASGSIGLYRA